jgi:hypothetical protein
MKRVAIILTLISLLASSAYSGDPDSTICRSSTNELKFRELAGPHIQVLAVCPKKGLYFVEIRGEGNDILQFKKAIKQSDLKVTKITTWKDKTNIGSMVLMVQFNY